MPPPRPPVPGTRGWETRRCTVERSSVVSERNAASRAATSRRDAVGMLADGAEDADGNHQSQFLDRHRMRLAGGEVCAGKATQRVTQTEMAVTQRSGRLTLDHLAPVRGDGRVSQDHQMRFVPARAHRLQLGDGRRLRCGRRIERGGRRSVPPLLVQTGRVRRPLGSHPRRPLSSRSVPPPRPPPPDREGGVGAGGAITSEPWADRRNCWQASKNASRCKRLAGVRRREEVKEDAARRGRALDLNLNHLLGGDHGRRGATPGVHARARCAPPPFPQRGTPRRGANHRESGVAEREALLASRRVVRADRHERRRRRARTRPREGDNDTLTRGAGGWILEIPSPLGESVGRARIERKSQRESRSARGAQASPAFGSCATEQGRQGNHCTAA